MKIMKKLLWLGLGAWCVVVGSVQASMIWSELERRFVAAGGSAKALKQVACYFERFSGHTYEAVRPTHPNFDRRCYDHRTISLYQERTFVVIDYTLPSDQQRLFVVDRQTGRITTMAVAHGKYEAGVFNSRLRTNRNTVREARYFSNEIDSNASSTGFYIAGQEYDGRYGQTIALFGLQPGINHNACERTIVIHGHAMVSQNRARIMSAGCPMVSHSLMPFLVEMIAGERMAEEDIALKRTGGLVYIYGPREAALPGNCAL
jgi:hypothetical protein